MKNLSVESDNVDWNNYSTTYIGDIKGTIPIIVTAIPYNGTNSNFDEANTPLDMSYSGSQYRFRSELNNRTTKLFTYDSSDVYFLALGVHQLNASKYQFEVLQNGKNIIKYWTDIDSFTNFQLNNFKKGFGFLGGYKTTWGNFLRVNIRQKTSNLIVSSAIVYWKETKPIITNVYTVNDFNIFFKQLKDEGYNISNNDSITKWQQEYKSGKVKTITYQPNENSLVFYLKGDVYKKEALEYQLLKNNEPVINWKANDFDNNFIWLKNLSHGFYTLNIRFSKQRQNITSCAFEIKPFWYQSFWFRFIVLVFIGFFVGFITVLFLNRRQKIKFKNEQQRKEKLNLELKSIRSQLNPHFIFNSLNSIQGLINKNEIDNANKYLSDFALLMRETLDGSDKQNNTLDKEIKTLDNYLQLEQLRFHFQYEITSSLNNHAIEIPSLLLQPILENAVKHGVAALQENGKIFISFRQVKNDILIEIKNNGKIFDVQQDFPGYGLKLTKERINLINETLNNQKILFDLISSGETTAIFTLKNWLV